MFFYYMHPNVYSFIEVLKNVWKNTITKYDKKKKKKFK